MDGESFIWKLIFIGTFWVLNHFWAIILRRDVCKTLLNFWSIINFQCIFTYIQRTSPPTHSKGENYIKHVGFFVSHKSKCYIIRGKMTPALHHRLPPDRRNSLIVLLRDDVQKKNGKKSDIVHLSNYPLPPYPKGGLLSSFLFYFILFYLFYFILSIF